MNPFDQRAFCILTGACGRFGRSLALMMMQQMANNSMILLVDKDTIRLEKMRAWLISKGMAIHANVATLDLAYCTEKDLNNLFSFGLLGTDIAAFRTSILIHAACVQKLSKRLSDAAHLEENNEVMAVELNTMIALSSMFLNKLKNLHMEHKIIVTVEKEADSGLKCMGASSAENIAGRQSPSGSLHRVSLSTCVSQGLVKIIKENDIQSGASVEISNCGNNNYVINYSFCSRPDGHEFYAKPIFIK